MDRISISDHNDHYFEAEEEFEVTVTGKISVSFDLSEVPDGTSLVDHLEPLLDSVKVEVDSIDDVRVKDSEKYDM